MESLRLHEVKSKETSYLLPVGNKYRLILEGALSNGKFLFKILEGQNKRSLLCHLKDLSFFEGTDLMQKACQVLLPLWVKPKDELTGVCVAHKGDYSVFQVWNTTGVLINTKLWDYIIANSAGCPPYVDDRSVVCTISHVGNKGNIFVHMEGSFVFDFEDKISQLRPEELKYGRADVVLRGAQTDEIYLAPDNDSLYRCVVTKIIPGMGEQKVCVRFIDYGNSAVVPEKSLLRALDIGIHIAHLPPLVLAMHLKGIESIPNPRAVYEKYKGLKFRLELKKKLKNQKHTAVLWATSPDGKMYSLNKGLLAAKLAIGN